MRCDDCEPLLDAYADGFLRGEEEDAVRAHLAQCRACRAEFDALRRDVKELQEALTPFRLKGGLRSRVLSALDRGEQVPLRGFSLLFEEMDSLVTAIRGVTVV